MSYPQAAHHNLIGHPESTEGGSAPARPEAHSEGRPEVHSEMGAQGSFFLGAKIKATDADFREEADSVAPLLVQILTVHGGSSQMSRPENQSGSS